MNVPPDGKWISFKDVFHQGIGYYSIHVDVKGDTAKGGNQTLTAWTDLGIIAEPHPGLRPESVFSSNTSGVFIGEKLDLVQAIGLKVMRGHFQPPVTAKNPVDGAYPLNFTGQDAAFAEAKEHGVWVLPIAGYALYGLGVIHKTGPATRTGMHGPPDNFDAFVKTWEKILRHYPEVTTYEFWNEPWIFGWTWCAPPEDYRKLQKAWCKMALKINPDYQIIAGNSTMFVIDHIEHDPSCWKKLITATSTHPYGWSTGEPTFRSCETFRSMDYAVQVTRRMGLERMYLTEGGTEYQAP
ncbi:MAG TPA: hypothetical protein VM223_10415, partial [Planctomycetota bacterium]|nr:hypothetical protein [Planctomycetota bacterium]